MNERTRNIAVGLMVLVALVLLAALIVIFTGLPEILHRGYRIAILFDETQEVEKGDSVRLAGVRVGSIHSIEFTGGDARKGVTITAMIHRGVRLPGNVQAYIHSRGLVGSGYIELKADGPPRINPDTGQPVPFLPTGGVFQISGSKKLQGEMIPKEISDAVLDMRDGFKDLSILAANLNRLVAPPSDDKHLSSLGQTLAKLTRTLDDLHAVIGDRENQANVRSALAGFAESASSASDAMTEMKGFASEAKEAVRRMSETSADIAEDFDALAKTLIDNAEKVSALTGAMSRAATKIESGKGTAGRLLNDDKLYTNLVEAADQLQKLITEMRLLAKTWQADGVRIKVK
ncbi:MAG: MCE family protein [Planctomycetes bacterium]|nr:MCE family protein [Planctomycetota bacterium]